MQISPKSKISRTGFALGLDSVAPDAVEDEARSKLVFKSTPLFSMQYW